MMKRLEPDQKLVLGHDLSSLQQLEDAGRTFSDDGWAQPVEQIVAHHGATYIRERLGVNPPIPCSARMRSKVGQAHSKAMSQLSGTVSFLSLLRTFIPTISGLR